MATNKKVAIVCSAHIDTERENLGDILSAKAIAILAGIQKAKIYFIPRDIGVSSNLPVIYGGGGMIRPSFIKKVGQDFLLRNSKLDYSIYGVGINIDEGENLFSADDIKAIKRWILSAKSVTVRDFDSLKFLRDNFKFTAKLAPCPTYTILRNIGKFVQYNKIKNKIGFVVSFGHTKNYSKFKTKIIKFIKNLINEFGAANVCIICHDEYDYTCSVKLFSEKGVRIVRPKTFKTVYKVYKECDSIITVRGHGVIFAAATDKPCSYIPLNTKLNSLYRYHYGTEYKNINFDLKYHLDILKKRRPPKDLSTNFKI